MKDFIQFVYKFYQSNHKLCVICSFLIVKIKRDSISKYETWKFKMLYILVTVSDSVDLFEF